MRKAGALVAAGALLASGLTFTAQLNAAPAAAETQKPDSSGLQDNTFYAYVAAGESLTVSGSMVSVTAPDGSVTTGNGVRGPAAADGVWIVSMTPPAGGPTTYAWEVTVQEAGGADVLGRVWSTMYTMYNPGEVLPDYRWWVINDSGYQYQVTTNGYNGALSRIRATAVGYTEDGTCTPLYQSVENTTGDWNPVADCAGDYRVFFEEPDASLPASAPSAEGTMIIAPEPLLESDLEATDISFSPTGAGSLAGTLSYAFDPRFSGRYTIQIDANGNGSYDDPEDRTETFGADGSPSYAYDFDGLDATGAAIDVCTPVTARVAFDRLGEVHVLQDDVEGRTGGIEIIRQTGPAAPDSTIYWDDTALTNPTTNTTPVLDGTAGIDSTGGVHGWGYEGLSWGGNNRGIDDWTYYATDATSPEVSLAGVANECLDIEKTSDATVDARVGDTVTYTVTATNTSEFDFTEETPATFSDDLTGVLDDATYNEDAEADVDGTIAYAEPKLSWTGALAAGETVTLSYTVTLTTGGDGVVRNVAYGSVPETPTPVCDPPDEDGTDPDTGLPCAENEFELPRLTVEKSADRTELPLVGDTVTYTVTATNEGPGVYTEEAPAVVVDDLSEVLDDAEFVDGSITTSVGDPAVRTGDRLRWEGALAAGETVTITYQVTYTAEGDASLDNVAWQPSDPTDPEPEPPVCNPRNADGTDPVTGEPCGLVVIPGGQYDVTKDVDPEDGSTVVAGDEVTYTITFDSTGTAPADIDAWIDDLSGVLDDAEIVTAPTASNPALTVSAIADDAFTVSGTIPQGESYTVTYTVRVLPDGERGDNVLGNVVFQDGTTPPEDCAADDPLCTVNPIPEIVDEKSVDPESGSVVQAGDELTYTLTFENIGEGAGTVDRVDDLTHVLDDADVTTAPVASDDALSVSEIVDGRFSITGELAPGQTVTVTYTVTVKAMDELGDTELGNFLLDPETPTPEGPGDCEPGDEDCTYNPVPRLEDGKSVDPASGTVAQPGDELTYTLTFESTGAAPVIVDRVDDLTHVLDDADVTTAPTASDDALSVSEITDGRFSITGELAPGQTVTVTYTVTVKAADELGDTELGNFLLDPTDPTPEGPGDCEPGDEDCTYNPVPRLEDGKSVDPASQTSVTAGQVLTYTLTFESTGSAPVTVDRVDDLHHVLDDADITAAPASSDPALTVSAIADGRFSIAGELQPGQTVTVSYSVTVKPTGERGDSQLANFLLDPGTPPPADPVCTDGEDCTYNPVSDVVVTKTADPESGTEVAVGQEIAYTLTFENVGAVAEAVDYTDHMDGVLDDADLILVPVASDDALSVSDVVDGSFSIAGELAAGQTVTVTYLVKVRDWAQQGDHSLGNVVAVTGQVPPAECAADSPLCTEHPTIEPPVSPPLATTGTEIAAVATLGALGVLIAAGGVILLRRGRRERVAEGDEIG